MTRARLVDAARTVFEQRGYGAASISDITAEAEIHRATFYLHFSGKAECFLGVIDKVLPPTAEYWRRLGKALMTDTPSAIRDWLADALLWYEEMAGLLPAWQEAMAVDQDVAKYWKAHLDELSKELDGYLAGFEPGPERDDVRLRVELLVVQMDQLCFRWLVQEVVECDRDRVVDMLADMWCGALHLSDEPD